MNNKEKKGYIYILTNPSMKGLVKIGMTNRKPELRVKELTSSSGVPTAFILYKAYIVKNNKDFEMHIHNILKPYRKNSKREFFEISPENADKLIRNEIKKWKGYRYRPKQQNETSLVSNLYVLGIITLISFFVEKFSYSNELTLGFFLSLFLSNLYNLQNKKEKFKPILIIMISLFILYNEGVTSSIYSVHNIINITMSIQ